MTRSTVGLLQPWVWLAVVVAAACGDSSANDGDSSFGETNDGPLDAPGDADQGDGDGDSMDGPGDGDGDPDGPGDGDGDPGDGDGEPGDGDGDPPAGCGDGMLDDGEACDDGNNAPGDGCSAYCQLPGTLIWEEVVDLDGGLDETGWAVAVDLEGGSGVIVEQDTAHLLARFDNTGALEWSLSSVTTQRPSLVIGVGGQLIAGGRLGTQGIVRAWDTTGTELWTALVVVEDSTILGLAIDVDHHVFAVGSHPGPNGFLARYDPRGMELWVQMQETPGALGPVAARDHVWAAREATNALERYSLDGMNDSLITPLAGPRVRDVVVDPGGHIFVLTEAGDQTEFQLTHYDAEGAMVWSQVHGGDVSLVSAGGLALLPEGGGLVVAASTNLDVDASDALLVWYDLEGAPLAPDVLIDLDDIDALYDVAVTPFNYAVAVGVRQAAGSDADLWIRKFEI